MTSHRIHVRATEKYQRIINNKAYAHQIDGVMYEKGSWWTADHITFQMLRDGVIEKVSEERKPVVNAPSFEAFFVPQRRGDKRKK